jgi:hypothetical protein
MYKCHGMGLLPTHSSDWLAFADPIARAEYSLGTLQPTILCKLEKYSVPDQVGSESRLECRILIQSKMKCQLL